VSTIQTTNLKHESSGSNNIVLSSAGGTTIGGNAFPTTSGTSGQFLQTNGSGTLSWAGAGKILQVVNAVYGTATSNATSTYSDTGLSATITPTATSSKILVLVNQAGCSKTANTALVLRLLRDATVRITFEEQGGYTGTTTENSHGSCSVCYLDSPATTSAVTYKTQFASLYNISSVYVQASGGDSTITLLEVAG